MTKDSIAYWRDKALDFLVEAGSLRQQENAIAYRRNLVLNLKKHAVCDAIYLTKSVDDVTERILVSSENELVNTFTDTFFLGNHAEEKNFVFHAKVSIPNRSHFLKKSESCVYIPSNDALYKGAIILSWVEPLIWSEGFEAFLDICVSRVRELLLLNATYLDSEELKVKFNAVFHTVSQALIFLDDEGKSAWINPRAKQLLEIHANEEEFVPRTISLSMKKLREKALNAEEINQRAHQLFRQPEQEIRNWIWNFENQVFRVASTPTISQEMKGRLWVFEDISELYFANKELERANGEIKSNNDRLEILNQEKNNLIGIVSHDLRTPLSQIKGFASIVALEKESLNKDQQYSFEKIIEVSDRGLDLIKDLLDISEIEQQNNKKKLIPINLKDFFQDALKTFLVMANKKDIRLQLHFEAMESTILADNVYFHRIIDNLVSNAIKFSFPNTSVLISISNNDTQLMIAIKDEGQGIKEKDKQHLFGKFKRLSARPTGDESSSGLGLSIVKTLVEALNGNIYCESEWGKGATFTVVFPLYSLIKV